MGAEMGFDAMFFGRIDLEDLDKRRKVRSLRARTLPRLPSR